MRFAVLADIHGNAFALRAVLTDMETLGITRAVNLGDHVSGPIDPAGTATLLMAREFPSIRGNHDRWLCEQDTSEMGPTDRVAHDQMTPDQIAWLAVMPATRMVFDDVFMCHGTPHSDLTYWLEKVDANGTIRAARLEEVTREAAGIDANLILCGHTHIPGALSGCRTGGAC